MTDLLDADVLIALCFPEHEHHAQANAWIEKCPRFAVCPITEGALVRQIMRVIRDGAERIRPTLEILSNRPGYEFWLADISYSAIRVERILGHRQVTDAYLVALAEYHGGRLVTFDRALAHVHPEAVLIPPI